jgi:hypothetical protein
MEQNPEFCVGVQIILKRMESNPEEFVAGSGKWTRILEQVVIAKEAGSEKLQQPNHLNGITAAEINALYDGYCKFLRKRFDDYVMREILVEAEELSYRVTSAPPAVLGGMAGSSMTTGYKNTAVGYKALSISLNTTNSHNTAFGYETV